MTVSQAYNIDKKVDDGLPTSGNVLAAISISGGSGISNSGAYGVQGSWSTVVQFSATSPNSTSCYDTTSGTYSMTINNGTGSNCGLSFKLQ
jgi:hypothetical protein